MTGTVTYGREAIRYEVCAVATRRTLGIEVHPDGRVLVRAPVGCPDALLTARVQKRAAWISRQLAEFAGYRPRTPRRQYVQGESHLYLGRQYRLAVHTGDRSGVTLTRGRLVVTVAGSAEPAGLEAVLRRWYLERARVVFAEVLDACLPRVTSVARPRLIVRAMRSRWGSLSSAGTMTLNVNLVRAPRACIEYVVIHELCHVTRRDHDARFFRLLGRVMPDWERRKQRLEAALL